MLPVAICCGDDAVAYEVLRVATVAGVTAERVAPSQVSPATPLAVCDAVSLAAMPRGCALVMVGHEPWSAAALAAALEAGARAALMLPADEARLLEALINASDAAAAGPVRAVIGASGGIGASTLAAAVAMTCAGLLVDLDRWGCGLDALLGLEDQPGPRWSELVGTHGRVSGTALRSALPALDGAAVLANDGVEVGAPALSSVVAAGRASGGSVVLDVPRHAVSLLATSGIRVDRAISLVSDDVVGVLAGRRLEPVLRAVADEVVVVLLRATSNVDSTLAERALRLPVVGTLSVDPRLKRQTARGASGRPTAAVLAVARRVSEASGGSR